MTTLHQVLFALVNLNIPDMLAKHGPMTVDQLTAALNASTKGSNVRALWLERLLTAAFAMGMLNRSKPGKKKGKDAGELLVRCT
jgi:hypothetical protein